MPGQTRPLLSRGWSIIFRLAFLAILSLPVLLLWRRGLLAANPGADGVTLIAAVLAQLGVIITGVIGVFGTLLTLAFKSRSETRLHMENSQSEDRLHMETAIRAVGLLSAPASQEIPKSQKTGSLFALANLG
jgi:hypothetical protein